LECRLEIKTVIRYQLYVEKQIAKNK